MNKLQLRQCLVRDKIFLKHLRNENKYQVRQTLNAASTGEIKTLAYTLHYLVKGEIPIVQTQFQKIIDSKKLNVLRHHFESVQSVKHLIKWTRQDQLTLFYKFIKIYAALLHPLFNLA